MEKLINDILAFVAQREQTILRICGHGGSGKTTFAQKIVASLPADSSYNLLSTDPYVILGKYSDDALLRYDLDGKEVLQPITACHPLRHELTSLKRDITMLRAGMELLTPDMPWQPAERLDGKRPLTIVEGMTPTFLERDLFDLSIFLYTDAETELARRLARDVAERGRNPEFIKQTQARRRKQYELYMEHHKTDFDIIVNDTAGAFQIEKTPF